MINTMYTKFGILNYNKLYYCYIKFDHSRVCDYYTIIVK